MLYRGLGATTYIDFLPGTTFYGPSKLSHKGFTENSKQTCCKMLKIY